MTTPMQHRNAFQLSRRQFLKAGLALGLAGSTGGLIMPSTARAAGGAPLARPLIVNIALDGGPDMRHLFPPAWTTATGSFGNQYWRARARVQRTDGGGMSAQQRWQSAYMPVSHGQTQFGMLRKCGFLKRLWDNGNVALVNNVYGATTRDHMHAQMVMEQGNMSAASTSQGSGWGGRLAHAASGHVLALSRAARQITFGPDPRMPTDLSRVDKSALIHIADTRSASLHQSARTGWIGPTDYLTRSLESYYAAKRPTLAADSPYFPILEQERIWRILGAQIDARLQDVAVPEGLQALIPNTGWSDEIYIAKQMLNLHDALACHDILGMRVASLEYPGWDSHANQADLIEPKAEHLFGDNGVLAALHALLPTQTWQNLVFVIGGEFGRQLRDNGARGTDHGVGTTLLVIGGAVHGGLYGDMFPETELARLNEPSPDIDGLTAIDHVYGALCNWVQPDTMPMVFPSHATMPLESGVAFGGLIG